MNLIHRHIFTNVVLTCAAAVGMFVFVLLLGSALKDLLGHVLAGQLAIGTVVQLIAYSIPVVLSYALPMGMLTGVLLVLGRMSSDREVTALRASGLSIAWFSAPILFCALLGVMLNLVINLQFMPLAKVAYETELASAIRQNPLSFIIPKTFIRDFPGYVIYAGDKKDSGLKDFWLWKLDGKQRVTEFVRAESGRVKFDEKKNELVLTLEHARVDKRNQKDPEDFSDTQGAASADERFASADELPIVLSLDKIAGGSSIHLKQKWLTFDQLMQEWRRLGQPDPALPAAEREKLRMRVQITIHEKFATAFSVLSFALIAIPLGIKVSRKETSANLGMGLAMAMAYYFATIVIGWFDTHTALRPDLLMWLPNLVFQGAGLAMFYRIDRS
ncbi:MAG TPA: LptF/LptG family permease [Lacunisphaera sp.]|jgi:lipopolysaccharide export system permease protein